MICKLLYKAILNTQSPLFEKVLNKIKGIISKFYNPVITLTYKGFTLKMPFDHTIFINQKHFPNYDMQLHKIAKTIVQGGGDLRMIDIGANIGDTIVFTNIPNGKYLLIEGEKAYNSLIEANLANNNIPLENSIIENVFIGDSDDRFLNNLKDGSGSLIKTDRDALGTSTVALDFIVEKWGFEPNFIKIDTDGFDFKVIRSAKHTLKKYNPPLYFEWDKFFLEKQKEDPLSIFPFLKELGYEDIFIFDNFGTLLCKEQVSNTDNLNRLLNYTERSNLNIYYYDLLVVPTSCNYFDSIF